MSRSAPNQCAVQVIVRQRSKPISPWSTSSLVGSSGGLYTSEAEVDSEYIRALSLMANRPSCFVPGSFSDSMVYWALCHPKVVRFQSAFESASLIVSGRLATGKTAFSNSIITHALNYISRNISAESGSEIEFTVSAIELLGDSAYDMLDVETESVGKGLHRSKYRKNLRLIEDPKDPLTINAEDVTEVYIRPNLNVTRLVTLLKKNRTNRNLARNSQSSCGHMILTIKSLNTRTQETARLNIVDLAPSLQLDRQSMDSVTIGEVNIINQSHEALLQVCRQLNHREKTKRIPYRSSRLTRLLHCSLTTDCDSVLFGLIQNTHFSDPETRYFLNYLRQISQDTDESYQSLEEWFRMNHTFAMSLPSPQNTAFEASQPNTHLPRDQSQHGSVRQDYQRDEKESTQILYDEAKSVHVRIPPEATFIDMVNIFSELLDQKVQQHQWPR